MTEHVHEWRMKAQPMDGWPKVICVECMELMHDIEVERRLNATERLSAETAGGWLILLREEGYDSAALAAYAAALEGE